MNFVLKEIFKKLLRIKFKTSFIIVVPMWLLLAIFFYKSVIEEVNNPYLIYRHPSQTVSRPEFYHHYMNSKFKKLTNILNAKHLKQSDEIPLLALTFKQSKLNRLFSNLPSSGKENFIKGHLELNGKRYRIEAKLRGGSYWHWMNDHKSWRLRILDGKKVFGLTSFDIVNPKVLFSPNEVLAHEFSRKLNLWNVESRMIRLNINNKYSGHSFTLSRINQEFLNRNKVVSGSVYGIDTGDELIPDEIFYTTAKAWKTGEGWLDLVNYEHELSRTKELRELAKALSSKNKNDFYMFFKNHFNQEKMFKYMALDSILGVYHHSNSTSQRYYFNNKEGKFSPIPWDHLDFFHMEYVMVSRNPIFDNVRINSELNHRYLTQLYSAAFNELRIDSLINSIDKQHKILKQAIIDDPNKDAIGVNRFLNLNPTQIFSYNYKDYQKINSFNKSQLRMRNKFLKNYFNNMKVKLNVENHKKYTRLEVVTEGHISPELINFSVRDVFIDSNNNKIFDDSDQKFYPERYEPIKTQNHLAPHSIVGDFSLMYPFIGNKGILPKKQAFLFFTKDKRALTLSVKNPFTKETQEILGKKAKNFMRQHNSLIQKEELSMMPSIIIGPGKILITKSTTYKSRVRILPNTKISLEPNTSVIYAGGIVAEGTDKQKIEFNFKGRKNEQGVVVIKGAKANNSILRNVVINGGGRSSIDLIEYSAVLNIFNTKNIIMDSVRVSSKCPACVGVNLYKAHNFLLKKVRIENFYNRLLDLDVSKGKIVESIFKNTLLDAVRVRYGSVEIIDSEIKNFFNSAISFFKSKVIIKKTKVFNGGTAFQGAKLFLKDNLIYNVTKVHDAK